MKRLVSLLLAIATALLTDMQVSALTVNTLTGLDDQSDR